MLRYIYADQLHLFPRLGRSMFVDRARQFHDRLGWEVMVGEDGAERDDYDDMNPMYVFWENADGQHGGSMRFLPTTGDTMVNDHFLDLTDGVRIESPFIWECTRFCLSPAASGKVAGALMLAGAEFGLASGLSHSIGVFDARMVHVYRRLGWEPVIMGTRGEGRDAISVGLWPMDEDLRMRLSQKSGFSPEISEHWYRRSFGSAKAA